MSDAIRFGINPLTWSNDDLPSLGAENSLELCLREAQTAGYAGVELGNKFPREPRALRAALEPHGLALVSGWYSARLLERDADAEFDAMQPHLELLAALGSDVMVVAEVTRCIHGDRNMRQSRRPHLAPAEWPVFAARLTRLAELMRARGMRLAYHHHMGTVVQGAQDVDRLMATSGDAVGLLLDTGHLVFAGADPAAIARTHAQRIVHVHCKDVRAEVLADVRNRDTSFLDAVLAGVFTVPGDGTVDYDAVLAPIAAAGYRGWLVVEAEQDPALAHPLTYATLGHRNLAAVAERYFR
ncbi:MAG TPA: myo-inosose-2 dehydratase [Steroidobacteraceae bacterium]|nr:myo-inosose-2 dehydratase [Steroidobacteraceae bacterium]